MPEILVFGGCNGSGRNTIATNLLNSMFNIEYINNEFIMSQIDFADSQQINAIFQEAVDKAMPSASFAIAKHQERGESIAIANKNEKVIIIAAEDIDRLQLQKI